MKDQLNLLRLLIVASLVLFVSLVASAQPVPAARQLTLTYTAYLTGLSATTKPAHVWIPVPQSDERQTVTATAPDPAGGQFTTETKYGNRMYYRQLDLSRVKPTDTLKITFGYAVQITEKVVAEAKQLAPLPKTDVSPAMQVYLAPARLIPLNSTIDSLRRKIDLPAEPILAARKTYDYLIDNMVYNYKAPGAGLGDMVWACNSKTGDCSDYHSVFIGVMRSAGIPVDHVFGVPLRVREGKAVAKGWHCWARFYVAGPEWITIDASEADKHPEQRDYLFGTLGNEYLIVSHGRDVDLMPKQQGPALNIFADPYVEIDGKPFAGAKWTVAYENVGRN
jgi:transglutaminase-like putative cysteine protease